MKRVGIVVAPGFQILDLAVASVFELANTHASSPLYSIEMVSEHGGPVSSSAGVRVDTQAFDSPAFDTLLVTGGLALEPSTDAMVSFLRAAVGPSRRMTSICTGAFALAQAGILDGRRVTTHWAMARELQRRYPHIEVLEDKIFIHDGGVWTSAGMTSCIDMTLSLVEADMGELVSRAVARKMVVYHRRAGGQTQFSALLELAPRSDRIQSALSYARSNLREDLSVEQLAGHANLSARQFSRAFHAETGQSPAKAIEHMRVEAARSMIENGGLSIELVARESGFGDAERMRRSFIRTMGLPPQTVRRTAKLHS
jgi:transcriptional regulator GlxA family with amidase domain